MFSIPQNVFINSNFTLSIIELVYTWKCVGLNGNSSMILLFSSRNVRVEGNPKSGLVTKE